MRAMRSPAEAQNGVAVAPSPGDTSRQSPLRRAGLEELSPAIRTRSAAGVFRYASLLVAILTIWMTTGCQQQVEREAKTKGGGVPRAAREQDAEAARGDAETQPVTLAQEELAAGWISLFDGQTLFGWQHESQADWRVEDGAIVGQSGKSGLLATTTRFSDYVLKLQFRCEPDTSGGVFLSTTLDPTDVTAECYELSIAGADNPFPTGSLAERKAVEGDLNRSGWQSYEVRVEGAQVAVQLDGKQVLEYTDSHPIARGHIGLQVKQGLIEFRDIQLKPLGLQSIFNGENLNGWTTYPEMASKFTVKPQEKLLEVVDGRGQLETQQQYGDFVLYLECMTHAPELNSGIFFRCIPGELLNGYECQIHNGYRDGNRTRPKDCGTGGFFRRQDARRVVADDQAWFSMTLVADGPHMAAWVNGYQVSDWVDTREAHPNPRQGLRREPGTIMIQGHDPTTKLSFRNLRIVELRAGE